MNHRSKIAERKRQRIFFENATKQIICRQQVQLKTILEHLVCRDKTEVLKRELEEWF